MRTIPAICKINSRRGQSLLEFSLTLTVMILLLAGIVDFGRAFFILVELRDAAQEGALYGSFNPTDAAGIVERAKTAAFTPVDLVNDPDVTVPAPIIHGGACEGGSIEVQVLYTFHVSMPFLTGIIGSQTIPLRASVTDTILYPYCY
ncbi:MAG: pilus assembly protein [Anaerolineales bacterium]|nr:pilus assembly protein [Anaerolineales bacterium]